MNEAFAARTSASCSSLGPEALPQDTRSGPRGVPTWPPAPHQPQLSQDPTRGLPFMRAAAFCRAQQLQRCTHSLPAPFFLLQSTPARCSAPPQLPPHCSFPSQASTCQSLACFPPNIPLKASATALAGEGHLPSPQSSLCRRGWSWGSSCQESSLARRLGTMAQSTAPSSELPFPILPPSYDLPHPSHSCPCSSQQLPSSPRLPAAGPPCPVLLRALTIIIRQTWPRQSSE